MTHPIISRPGRDDEAAERLLAHSEAVASLAPQLVEDSAGAVAVAARLHDLGKATPYFQRYIRGQSVDSQKYTYHARLGAFATFHVLTERGVVDRTRLAALLGVLKHHGRLPNAADSLVDIVKSERQESANAYLGAQVAALDDCDAGRHVADELLVEASDGTASWESFRAALESGRLYDDIVELVGTQAHRISLVDPDPERLPSRTYDRTLYVWSALTLADKTCAANVAEDDRLKPASLALSNLEGTIEALRDKAGLESPPDISESDTALDVDITDERALNQLREAVRRHVRENAHAIATSDHQVTTLTLPTGLGKTLTGLTAAYTIRDTVAHEEFDEDHDPRMIYALPYTSIIEQTRGVFEDVFSTNPSGREFTVHHYLADTVTYPDVDVEGTVGDQAVDDSAYFTPARFAEAWRAGTTLTTFVQLFESLTGPTNNQGLKLSALHDAIIVLDEPQTLPKPWWPALRYLLRLLVEEYDAHVISMTATQPSLVTAAEFETVSLLSETHESTTPLAEACARAVERVTYQVDESLHAYTDKYSPEQALDYTTAGTHLVDRVTDSDAAARSVLAVCNTIASAAELTTAAKDAGTERGIPVTDLGAVYQQVIDRTASTPASEFESGMLTDQPCVDELAESVLWTLGFTVDEASGDSVADWEWVPPENADDIIIGSFSSRYRPRDRRVLIAVATVLARNPVPFVFVSTQAVEAGVDISFGAVYRDLAPLDSVVQAAGRCNRSFEWGRSGGEVTVWALGPTTDGTELPARFIYPAPELSEVATILTNQSANTGEEAIPDDALINDAIPQYYEWLETEIDVENRTLTTALQQCKASDLATQHLIDQSYETRDVLVAQTAIERAALEALKARLQSPDPADHAAGYRLLNQLNDLRVSVPVTELSEVPSSIWRVDGRVIDDAEGTPVLGTSEAGSQQLYDLTNGGLRATDVIADRFSF